MNDSYHAMNREIAEALARNPKLARQRTIDFHARPLGRLRRACLGLRDFLRDHFEVSSPWGNGQVRVDVEVSGRFCGDLAQLLRDVADEVAARYREGGHEGIRVTARKDNYSPAKHPVTLPRDPA